MYEGLKLENMECIQHLKNEADLLSVMLTSADYEYNDICSEGRVRLRLRLRQHD